MYMPLPFFGRGSHWTTYVRIREGVHQAVTREPGDLPAFGRSCLDPGDDHGTVFLRLGDEAVRLGLHGRAKTVALQCPPVPARRPD